MQITKLAKHRIEIMNLTSLVELYSIHRHRALEFKRLDITSIMIILTAGT